MTESDGCQLAEHFIEFTGDAFAADQHELVCAAIALAAHSLATPGDWSSLDGRAFMAQLADNDMIRIEAAMYLIGFLGWLGISGRLAPAGSLECMHSVLENAPPSPLLSELMRMAAGHLHSAAA